MALTKMRTSVENYDVVVAGGGLAGFCSALSAARRGLKSCLVQERPVLGGVASSEMRVSVHGQRLRIELDPASGLHTIDTLGHHARSGGIHD